MQYFDYWSCNNHAQKTAFQHLLKAVGEITGDPEQEVTVYETKSGYPYCIFVIEPPEITFLGCGTVMTSFRAGKNVHSITYDTRRKTFLIRDNFAQFDKKQKHIVLKDLKEVHEWQSCEKSNTGDDIYVR